ncbi:transposable element-related [Holotrichia oblita]|uniref:Transposable element-related n=1 Tax=Holotrichia oblita TaxID=644536 RepID=A0ACB9SJA9_HOLOL|nr:transposable element-related [Holotrichia oblita]
MNGEVYREEIINNVIPNFHAAIGQDFSFLDDNATPHRAARVVEARINHGIPHLPLPPRSPDLNCIEHAWGQLQRALDAHEPRPETLQQLRDLLPQLWMQLRQDVFNNLVESMQKRCEAVIKACGGHTTY